MSLCRKLEKFTGDQIMAVNRMRTVRSNAGTFPSCTPGCTFAEVTTSNFVLQLREVGILQSNMIFNEPLSTHMKVLDNFVLQGSPKGSLVSTQ